MAKRLLAGSFDRLADDRAKPVSEEIRRIFERALWKELEGAQMGYFPFFMDISGKKGVIAGGGRVAARKVEKLLAFGPRLIVIAPRIGESMCRQEKQLQEDGTAALVFQERAFQIEDIDGADFVIAATDDEMLNRRISAYCKAARIPVNVVDDREKCTFFFPALIKEGDLTIGISTDGKSPLAAAWVKEEISRMLPGSIGNIIDLMGQIRPFVQGLDVEDAGRKEILEQMFFCCLEKGGEVTLAELVEWYEKNPDRNQRQ